MFENSNSFELIVGLLIIIGTYIYNFIAKRNRATQSTVPTTQKTPPNESTQEPSSHPERELWKEIFGDYVDESSFPESHEN